MTASPLQNLDTALTLAAAGLFVFPCQSGGDKAKQPMPGVFWRSQSSTDEAKIRAWWHRWPDAAIGLDIGRCGLLVIDCDRHDIDRDGVQAFGDLCAANGHDIDASPLVATPSGGTHVFFRQPEGKSFGNGRGDLPPGVDVRGAGGYVIAPGTVMGNGKVYELWGDVSAAPALPGWLSEILDRKSAPSAPRPTVSPSSGGTSEMEELLSHIPADCGYDEWLAVLMAIHAETSGAGFDIADAWSARGGTKYCGRAALLKKWGSFRRSGVTGATIAEIARRYNADLSAIAIRHMAPAHDPVEAAEAARRIIEHHDGTLIDEETGEVIEAASAADASGGDTLSFPSGLVGEIAQWISDTARRPQPELAIGAALTIVGTAAGRQFSGPTKSGTHLYVLGLAPTGKGKDHPLQQIGRIMGAAGLSQHVGPSEFISMPSVVNFLMRKPLSICPMDEFGDFMKRINSKKASGFESSISKVIRTMWSSSFASYQTPEWASKPSETIHAPSMSLFGASTPEQFWSSMEGAQLENGTLNRFLLMPGRREAAERDPLADPMAVPDHIVDGLRRIYFRSGEIAAAWRNDASVDPAAGGHVRVFPWCADGSKKTYEKFGVEIERLIDRDHEAGAFYARSVEMALRIATIIAIGRMGDEQVRKEDMEAGIEMARQSARIMAAGAADYMADNENQANAQRIVRAIKARGGRCSYRDLSRSLQNSIRSRDLRDLLASMCDAGQLERQEVKRPSGPSVFWYQIETSPP